MVKKRKAPKRKKKGLGGKVFLIAVKTGDGVNLFGFKTNAARASFIKSIGNASYATSESYLK